MKLAAGLLAPAPWATAAPATALVAFRLSPHLLDEAALLESCFASPGRYAGEILRRLRQGYPQAPRYLVVNPYLEVAPSVGEQLVQRALELGEEAGPLREAAFVVISDGRRPLAYLFPAATAARCPPVHLGLLSSSDAALDERLLAASFGAGQTRSIGQLAGLGARDGGHGFVALSPAVARTTLRAAEHLEALPTASARAAAVDGPRCAVIGFHAGDVLFWAEALQLEPTPFRSAAVLSIYADVLRYAAPAIECLAIEQPAPHRPGHHVVDDLALLDEYAAGIAEGPRRVGLLHPFRPFRDYSRPRHHLREAMAFAAGGPGSRLRPPPRAEAALRERRLSTPLPGRVLCHFEGGWALKEYPRERRAELLQLLLDAGYDPVVIGKPEPDAPAVPAVPYRDLASYRALLGGAAAVVGCDSFPAHFSQQLGVPTLQLFGSTRPDNARGLESPRYRLLHRPLPCVPCNLMTTCSLDGSNSCRAHATPHEVLAALEPLAPPPRPGNRPAPRPLDEARRLLAEDVPSVGFPSRPAMAPWQRERFLDRMFEEVRFERVTACPLCGGDRLEEKGRRFRLPVAACPGCGLWLVTERIAEPDLPILYSQRYWTDFMRLHGYPAHHQRYPYDYAAALERVVDLAELVPPDPARAPAVLDIGCALGAVPRRLREHGYRGHGLELDAGLAREARLLSGAPVHTSLEAVRAAEPALAAVVMYDVFEHLYHPVAFVRALAPLLEPGGWLLIETFRTDSPAFAREGLDHEDVKPIEHPFMYRLEHLERLLRQGGFTPARVRFPLGEDHARVRVAARREGGAPA